MSRDHLHTTAAIIPVEALGTVYGVKAPPAFWDAWLQATNDYRKRQPGAQPRAHARLPYSLLADAITHHTGALANIERKPAPYIMVLSDPIPLDTLAHLMDLWEAVRVELGIGYRTNLATHLRDASIQPIDLAEHLTYPDDERCPIPPTWAWNVLTFQLARRLARVPLTDESGGKHALRLVAPVAHAQQRGPVLLTWDNPLRGASRDDAHEPDRAMVQLTPRVLQVPGYSKHLILSVHVSTTRIARHFVSGRDIKSGWVRFDDARPIIPVRVNRYGGPDGEYRYAGHELFQHLERFPPFTETEVRQGHRIRLRWRSTHDFGIGAGVGQGTYEVAAQHLRATLEPLGAQMLSFRRRVGNVPTGRPSYKPQGRKGTPERDASERTLTQRKRDCARAAAHAAPNGVTRIILLAARPHTLARMRDGMRNAFELPEGTELATLSNASPAFHPHDAPGIEIVVRHHPDLDAVLLEKGDSDAIAAAVLSCLSGLAEGADRVGVLIETTGDYARAAWKSDKQHADPKHVLMLALAEHGMATQFLANTEGRRGRPNPHPAAKAAQDLLRSLGVLPRDPVPLPAFPHDADRGTLFVGIAAVKSQSAPGPTRRAPKGVYVSIVAQHAGAYRMEAWSPAEGGAWSDVGCATIAFNRHRHTLRGDEVHNHVQRALVQLRTRNPSARIVAYVDASGPLRGIFGLRDSDFSPSGNRPALPRDLNVVRVRAIDEEVPHSAAAGPWGEGDRWDLTTLFSSRTMLADLDPKPAGAVAYFFTTSAHFENPKQARAHRTHSRFTVSPSELKHPWHSLTTTELIAWQTDGATEPDDLILTSAMLCRYNPYWEGDTNLPSPLHLANAMLNDHPARKSELDDPGALEGSGSDNASEDADDSDGA